MVQHLSLEKKEIIDRQQALSRKMTSNEKINYEKYDMVTIANTVSNPSNGVFKQHLKNISLSNLNASGIGLKNEQANLGLNNEIMTNANANNNIQINQYLKNHMLVNTPTNTHNNKFFSNNQFEMSKATVKNLSPNTATAAQATNNSFINNKNKENDQYQLQLAQQGVISTNYIVGNNCEDDITNIEESDDNKLKTNKSSLNETVAHTNSNSTHNIPTPDIKVSKRYDTVKTSFALVNNHIKKDSSSNNLDMEVINNLVHINNHHLKYLLMFISNRLKWEIKRKMLSEISRKNMDSSMLCI